MVFISYAQNLEDVMLWRALKHVERGFYVDVGANDPEKLSITQAFYQRDWHGINIDPVTYDLLNHERLRDINLRVAVGAAAGEIVFYETGNSALSTSDPELAKDYRQAGQLVTEIKVPLLTLNQILEEHATSPIHFMNIDVEGAELEVLKGLDLVRWRPWIILIEATLPNTRIPTFDKWERLIVSNDYEFVYFDGLNRFYVAREHRELAESFNLPPNIFDNYVLAHQFVVQQELEKKEAVIQQQKVELEIKKKAILEMELEAKEAVIQIQKFELEAKAKIIRSLELALVEKKKMLQSQELELETTKKVIQAQQIELEAKDKVIQAQKNELEAKEKIIQNFRASYFYWIVNGPFRWFPQLRPLTIRIRDWSKIFAPKIGVLEQHTPKAFRVPAEYTKVLSINANSAVRISVVTPSYNQAQFIERTVKSVLDQSYPDLEYLIQDGGSTDGTLEVLEPYQQKLTHFESHNDNGQAHAINLGMQRTSGKIMAYLNSDDLFLPGTLWYVANYFVNHPEVDVIYGHRVIINEKDEEIGRWVLPPHDDHVIQWADYIPQETLFWRRELWEKVGGKMDETYHFALDWELIIRFRAAGAKIVRVPRFLGAFRIQSAQKTTLQLDNAGLMEMNRIRKQLHGRDVSWEEINKNINPYLRRSVIYHKLYRLGLLRY
jgi:FkbM family methyltransferase